MNGSELGAPSRRVWLGLVVVLLFGVLVRTWALRFTPHPDPVDSIYHVDVARNLCEGRGLVTDYTWNYVRGVPDALPAPSHGYWNPGMAFFLVPWMKLLGPSYFAGQVANVCLGIPLLVLVWRVGRELGGSDAAGLLGAGLAAVEPLAVTASMTADPGLLHSVLVAAALLCMDSGLRRDTRWLAPAGLLAGLAHLTRNDGILLLAVFGVLALLALRGQRPMVLAKHGLLFVVPYTLVIGPWLVRNALVFGSPTAPALSRLLYLPAYTDIFRADLASITFAEHLAAHGGLWGAAAYRAETLWQTLTWTAGRGGGYWLLVGVPVLWLRRPLVARPYVVMLGALLVAYGVVLPEVGYRGAYVRTFPCLYPLILGSAGAGTVWLAAWLAGRLPVSRQFAFALPVALMVTVSLLRLAAWLPLHHEWVVSDPYDSNAGVLQPLLDREAPGELLFTDDAWRLHGLLRHPVMQIPSDGLEKAREIAEDRGIRHAVMKGLCLQYIPGLEDAVESGDVAVVQKLETVPYHEGLYLLDLFPDRGGEEAP